MNTPAPTYPIDSSAILYLAQMGPDHTNVYRFTIALADPVEPALLQQAVERICPRFPTIFAGFCPGQFQYTMVPADQPPQVQPDPGLLRIMPQEEIQQCAYRVYYSGCHIIIEAFHALTDGYGAVASIRALLAEYVFLRHGASVPEREDFFQTQPDWEEELRDVYLDHSGKKTGSLPRQYAYQLPRVDTSRHIHTDLRQFSTQSLRAAAKRCGVSITSMLSTLMAEAIMELQNRHSAAGKKPVRIMVPIDLRRQFPSKTFRNFILYALPTLRPEDAALPRKQRLKLFQQQLAQQTSRDIMAAQITRNVRIQQFWLFRILPTSVKCALMRLSYRFFGESNSSITLTNLGPVPMSEALQGYVSWIQVSLMPRRSSPYNCGLLSCGDVTSITITRFGAQIGLEELFFQKLHDVVN